MERRNPFILVDGEAIASQPSSHAQYQLLDKVTPEVAEALRAALQLANCGLAKLKTHGRAWYDGQLLCAEYEEGGFHFGSLTQLPLLPSAVGASEPWLSSNGSRSIPLFFNGVVIAHSGGEMETLLRVAWRVEGQFSVSWFARGDWEQQLRSISSTRETIYG